MTKSPALPKNLIIDGTCLRIPREYLKAYTLDYAFVAGEVFSYSSRRKDDAQDAERHTCTRTYKSFGERLGCSVSTVGRAVRVMAGNVFQRTHRSHYQSVLEVSDDFVRAPYYIFNTQFKIRGRVRALTPTERGIFALIYTACDNGKKGKNKVLLSNNEIAQAFKIRKETASRLTGNLIAAGLIIDGGLESDAYGVRKSKYHINKKLLKNHDVAADEAAKTESREREEWYSERRHAAEDEAERCRKLAKGDKEYAEANKKLMDLYIAEAREKSQSKLRGIRAEQERWAQQQLKALGRLGLTPDDLVPRYHCPECNDTGYDKHGRPCRCYDKAHSRK